MSRRAAGPGDSATARARRIPSTSGPIRRCTSTRNPGQALSGSETRNLNRAYPGQGRRIAHRTAGVRHHHADPAERSDLAIDLHEASPEYPVVNTMVAHQRAMDLAALANVDLQDRAWPSGSRLRRNRCAGCRIASGATPPPRMAVLAETTNPAQGRLRGATSAALVSDGRDRFYVRASARGRLSVPFPRDGWPLDVRVARHLATVRALVATLAMIGPSARWTSTACRPTPRSSRSASAALLQPPPGGPEGRTRDSPRADQPRLGAALPVTLLPALLRPAPVAHTPAAQPAGLHRPASPRRARPRSPPPAASSPRRTRWPRRPASRCCAPAATRWTPPSPPPSP